MGDKDEMEGDEEVSGKQGLWSWLKRNKTVFEASKPGRRAQENTAQAEDEAQ